jgi:hypothetical protein
MALPKPPTIKRHEPNANFTTLGNVARNKKFTEAAKLKKLRPKSQARARELAKNDAAETADNKTPRAKTPTLSRSATLPRTKKFTEAAQLETLRPKCKA